MAVATKTPEKHEVIEKHDVVVKDEAPVLIDAPPVITQFATPVGVDELTLDPDAVQGSRHVGPLISGAPEDGAGGIAVLQKRVKISTVQHGSFSVPVRFPASSILLNYTVQIQQSYNGTLAKVNLGTTLNGTDIANVDVTVAPTQLTSNITSVLGSTWTIYLSQVIGAGGTAGKSTVLVSYSVPAKVLPS
jgi:hypothetical protein